MKDLQQQFNQLKKEVVFDPARKQQIRQNLMAHMTVNPAEQQTFLNRLINRFSSRSLSFVAIFLAILVAGTGTAFAANNALPGQALYQVKTRFNEPIRAALMVDSNSRAAYQVDLAAKRVEEARALSAHGQLSAELEAELSSDLENHANRTSGEVQKLLHEAQHKMRGGDFDAAARLGQQASVTARLQLDKQGEEDRSGSNSGSEDHSSDNTDDQSDSSDSGSGEEDDDGEDGDDEDPDQKRIDANLEGAVDLRLGN